MDLTLRMSGKRVAQVMANGHVLSIRMHDGSEINVIWVSDKGEVQKGMPVLLNSGVRLIARDVNELINTPPGVQLPAGVK